VFRLGGTAGGGTTGRGGTRVSLYLYPITFYSSVDKLHQDPRQWRGGVVFDFDFDDTITCRPIDETLQGGFFRLYKRDEGTLWCRGTEEVDQLALAVAFALSPGLRMTCVSYTQHDEWLIAVADRAA
jgi:hypothetical protein